MKTRQSKLDAHAEQLRAWDVESLTLKDMAAQLKERGCSITLGALSSYLASLRQRDLQARLLGQITTGSRACKEVEAQFRKDAPPELDSLIKLHRVLIMQLATQASADPTMIELVSGSMKPLLQFAELQLKEKSFALDKEKFQRETCELFLKWSHDVRAKEIANSPSSHAEKLDQLYLTMFGKARE